MPEADASPLHSGLFLDLDGTLADSLTALKNVYHSFLASFGASGDEVEFHGSTDRRLARLSNG